MKSLIAPFDAYKGKEPYIFVSYAHKNSEIVFRHITRLKNEGFRIWYDEGIDPGTDWSDAIAYALANATSFLVFVSPEMVESHNVKKEIVFALSRKKHMIAVHIAETKLPDGLDMQLSNIQALLENRFNDNEKFYGRLFAAFPPETRGSKQPVVESVKKKSTKGIFGWFKREQKKEQPTVVTDSNPSAQPASTPVSSIMGSISAPKTFVSEQNQAPKTSVLSTPQITQILQPSSIPMEKAIPINSVINVTKFTPKTISVKDLNVVHPPLSEKDYFYSGAKVMYGMVQMGEWLYFQNHKIGDYKLYKIKVNGEGLTRISKGSASYTSMFNGYVYFSDEARNKWIFRTNGEECQKFIDVGLAFPFILTPKGLVYSQRGYAGNPFMGYSPARYVLVDYNGNTINEENFFAHEIFSDENYVILLIYDEKEGASFLYCADFDGTHLRKICDDGVAYIVGLSKGFIYFANKDDNNKIYKVYTDGSQFTKLNFSYNGSIIDGIIYYIDNCAIKRHIIENEEDELLLKFTGKMGLSPFFNVIGNWMFIQIESREQEESDYYLCRMSMIDGTFETIAKLTD